MHIMRVVWSIGTFPASVLLMRNTTMAYVVAAAGLLLLADKATASPIMLGTPSVPDGGSTALLLFAGLGGVAAPSL